MSNAIQGLGNQGIAYRLKISPITVGVHLSKVYRKVGVGGRTELAHLAGRGGASAPPPSGLPRIEG